MKRLHRKSRTKLHPWTNIQHSLLTGKNIGSPKVRWWLVAVDWNTFLAARGYSTAILSWHCITWHNEGSVHWFRKNPKDQIALKSVVSEHCYDWTWLTCIYKTVRQRANFTLTLTRAKNVHHMTPTCWTEEKMWWESTDSKSYQHTQWNGEYKPKGTWDRGGTSVWDWGKRVMNIMVDIR